MTHRADIIYVVLMESVFVLVYTTMIDKFYHTRDAVHRLDTLRTPTMSIVRIIVLQQNSRMPSKCIVPRPRDNNLFHLFSPLRPIRSAGLLQQYVMSRNVN